MVASSELEERLLKGAPTSRTEIGLDPGRADAEHRTIELRRWLGKAA